ncbi:MAG TPA: 7TM diverse intracellular signaling domain-containing protein, partial [Ramlibacter sp.]|nr:7TM diverse intracellular signaling domain-containing protein [Ramlibacter sp.]
GWRVFAAACFTFIVFAPAAASGASALPVAGLSEGGRTPVEVAYVQALVPRSAFSISQVAAGRLEPPLARAAAGHPAAFSPANELWIALRVVNSNASAKVWTLQVRQTSLDEITLFEPAGEGWRESHSGDRVPQSHWARPGRFPRFDLQLQPHETRDVFLRIRNDVPAPVPLQLADEFGGDASAARADFGLAFALGMLALLAIASLIQGALYSDGSYFIFGGYALLLGFALASMSGVTDQFLWGEWPAWSDASKTVFPMAAAGMSVWLVEALCRIRNRSAVLGRVATSVGAVVLAMAFVRAFMHDTWTPLVAAAMLPAACTVLLLGTWTWRRGDNTGAWVLAAHVPIMATTALIVLRMIGIEPIPFRANVLVAVSMGFILLLMLVALIRRSKELLSVRMRAQGMESIDPLTGMLSADLFRDRVRAAGERFRRSRHDAAVIHVKLANFERIREQHGLAVAEQSMIRAAMKLQRVMREADCFGRVGESTLGLIVETVTRRDALLERASRLVAHGLMPLPGLKPEVTLILHVAISVLSENPHPAPELQTALDARLDSMTPRTRKPIRFVRRLATAPMPLEADVVNG